jgi:PadR family transcriptional regulator PadR
MPADLLQGTLNMLILQVLSRKKANGYEIAKLIEQRSAEALQVDHGSLYPALRRLEASGWITSEWALSSTNRRARYYALTAAGRKQIGVERSRWRAAVLAVSRVMRPA